MTLDPDRERYVNLATLRKDGAEVRTPVWIAVAEGVPVVYTNATSWKVKRICNDAHVRLSPCTARGDIRGDWVDATARIVNDDAARDRGLQAFVDKYGWQMRLALFVSRFSGRYNDRTIIELQL
ncbi:MAG: PPOX class F420-dependent oxidoreductase [Acidobacteriota bacterium]|nr:MAG: PPOX class F420-dependent oxidoreductase [Acidobacteriota bacterium]